MSSHPQDELLAAALDGTLSAHDRETLDAHLAVCARCRGELELARGARGALRDLPVEVHPPIDVAAAVTAEIAGGGRQVVGRRGGGGDAEPATPSTPRWYRAAGLVAAAAAIVLAVLIVPNVVGRDTDDRTATAALEAGDSQSAPEGTTGPEAGAQATTGAARGQNVEVVVVDFDDAALRHLADEATKSSINFASGTADGLTDQRGDRALDCVRSAAGGALPSEAAIVRLLQATFEGTPAYIGVFDLPDGGAAVWASDRGDCRALTSVSAPPDPG